MGGVSLALTRSSPLTLTLCAGYLFGGLMFGPDLDVRSIQYKRWGWFRWIWIPYRGSLKHRSPLSHSPITGTALRIVYLLVMAGFWGLVLVTIANQLANLGWTWADIAEGVGRSLQAHRFEILIFCGGIELGALSHIAADGLLTLYKRYQKQGWTALIPPSPLPNRKRQRKGKGRSGRKGRSN